MTARDATTAARRLGADPRIAEARRLIHEAVRDAAAALEDVRPADPGLAAETRRLIEAFGGRRGGPLYYPYLGSGAGRGPLVELADGSVKYDMICGIGVHYLGHAHHEMIDAAVDAALSDTVMQGNLQQNVESAQLVESFLRLATARGAPLEHCFLSTSGAMANENALKLAFCRHQPADRLLTFERCFAGRTMVLAQVTDKPAYRVGLPPTVAVDRIPFFDAADPDASTAAAVAALDAHLERHRGRHAAMVLELIQGEGGYYPGRREFFLALIARLRAADVAVIVDEIQTFGRTISPFAFSHFGLDEHVDIVTVGKLSQVCATLYRADYRPPPGLISQTFTGATAAIFAARRILDTFERGDLFGLEGRIARLSCRFVAGLEAIARREPGHLSGPFGYGAMIAFTPLDGSPASAKALVHALFEAGVIAFVAGSDPARVRMLPPMAALSESDVDRVCEIIEHVLAQQAAAPGG